jgi:hypothetical protein
VLIQALAVGLAQGRFKLGHVSANQVQNAFLAVHPALILHSEQAVEQVMRNHFGRQRAFVTRPGHIALHVLAVGFLSHSDLQGAEAGLGADSGGEDLIDGRTARAPPGEPCRSSIADASCGPCLASKSGGDVIDSANHVDVVPHGRQGRDRA